MGLRRHSLVRQKKKKKIKKQTKKTKTPPSSPKGELEEMALLTGAVRSAAGNARTMSENLTVRGGSRTGYRDALTSWMRKHFLLIKNQDLKDQYN